MALLPHQMENKGNILLITLLKTWHEHDPSEQPNLSVPSLADVSKIEKILLKRYTYHMVYPKYFGYTGYTFFFFFLINAAIKISAVQSDSKLTDALTTLHVKYPLHLIAVWSK